MNLPRKKAGDPVRAADWNMLCDLVERQALSVAAPLGIQVSSLGTLLTVAGLSNNIKIAKIDGGGFTGRSGTTMGTGTIVFYSADADGTLHAGDTTNAATFSATAIPGNKYCLVVRVGAPWVVAAVEC